MAQEINENTQVKLDLKTIGIIIAFTLSLAGTYYTLQSQIDVAMNEPKPEVSSIEFQYKDELVRSTIEKIELDVNVVKDDVKEIKDALEKIEDRLYEVR